MAQCPESISRRHGSAVLPGVARIAKVRNIGGLTALSAHTIGEGPQANGNH
jgi:hypothetical protein